MVIEAESRIHNKNTTPEWLEVHYADQRGDSRDRAILRETFGPQQTLANLGILLYGSVPREANPIGSASALLRRTLHCFELVPPFAKIYVKRIIIMGGGAQVGQVAGGAISEADLLSHQWDRVSVFFV
jgi:hypothetical protein